MSNLEQHFCAIERLTGLHLTIYDLVGCLADAPLPSGRRMHVSHFCKTVKLRKERECIQCDKDQLFVECLDRNSCFIRTCHAGADEVIIPVSMGGKLLCVGLLGQFISSGNDRPPAPRLPELPRMDDVQADSLLSAGELLRGYVLNHCASPSPFPEPQAVRIRRFIKENVSSDPRLEDLAGELGLSESRARHVVKDACGEGFQALKDDARMAAAMELLTTTDAPLSFVARQSGFTDPDYFCRFFKKHKSMTPGNYRRGQSKVLP